MRATERLLEVVEGSISGMKDAIDELPTPYREMLTTHMRDVRDCLIELRRRGDTLVRRDDLVEVCEGLGGGIGGDPAKYDAALDRLENAIGGKLR